MADMQGAGVVAPQFADLADATLSDQSASLQSQMERNLRETAEKRKRSEEAATKQREALLAANAQEKKNNQGVLDAMAAPVNAQPAGQLVTQPQPSRKLTDFLAPVAGESPKNTITKLIQGIGLMASGIVGLRRGDATAALAGLHGALKGWQEGDKERADRAFADWDAATRLLERDWERRHREYRDALENHDMNVSQALTVAKLKAIENGHDAAVSAFDVEQLDKAQAWLDEDRRQLRHMQERADTLRMQHELKSVQFSLAQQARDQANEHWLRDYQQRERLANQRLKESQSDKPIPGEWFDRKTRERAYPTLADFHSPDFAERFHKTNTQGVTRVEQISIALPMIDRLRTLTTKILADQPVQNLVKALELEGQGKMASNPDLREWQALVKDTNVKMTSVMGPGQFRVTLLHVLQGAGLKTTDTQATAGRLLDQWETNIENDLAAITGSPLRAHLSGPWRGWATSPEGQKKVIELGKGERIDPGWKPLEEIK